MNKKQFAAALYPRYSSFVAALNMNAKLKAWIREHDNGERFDTRAAIYHHLVNEHLGNGPIDLLEFGVAGGDSLGKFCQYNTHPDSRFFGFDTFEGLPEDWDSGWGTIRKGSYSNQGQLPDLQDDRVRFVKGFYQDVMNDFLASYQPRGQIVCHIDCDLYTSSLYVLTKLDRFRARRPLVLMDDFSSPNHMFRAFDDYVSSYAVDYDFLFSAGDFFHQVCVQLR